MRMNFFNSIYFPASPPHHHQPIDPQEASERENANNELPSQASLENKPRGAPPGRFAGERVRAGSSRPPHITSEISNNTMPHPQRIKAAREYRQELAAKAAVERAQAQEAASSSSAAPAPVLTGTVCPSAFSRNEDTVLTDALPISSEQS